MGYTSYESIVQEPLNMMDSMHGISSVDESIGGEKSSSYKIVVDEAMDAQFGFSKVTIINRSWRLAYGDEVSKYPIQALIGILLGSIRVIIPYSCLHLTVIFNGQ